MKFSYEIYDIGWANAYIEINGYKDYFSVSYMTDGLKDLVEGVLTLLPECMPNDEVKKKIVFEWYAEPGGAIWTIESINNNQLHILIKSFEDLDLKIGGKITLDEECYKTDFIQCIVDEMDSILKEYGLVGYRKTWYSHDFPISTYLKLKNYLMDGRGFQVEHIERYPGNEYSKSELQKELALLDVNK